MKILSRELLSAVYGQGEVEDLKTFGISSCGTNLILQYDDYDSYVNIYELMHLMKEWANKMDITIDSGYDGDIAEAQVFYKPMVTKYFHFPTEFEAVTKACEWILEQINESK